MSTFLSKPWRLAGCLWLLGMVSVLFGLMHMFNFASGQTDPDAPHYELMPVPIVIHLITGTLMNLLIPLQFEATFRRKHRGIHRLAGSIVALCVMITFVSTLWMNHFYPAYGGSAKYWGIWAHNLLLVGGCLWALIAISKGNLKHHRLGMVCMAAAALSPATQRIVIIPIFVILGDVSDALIGAIIWFGLIFNLCIAFYFAQTSKTQRAPEARDCIEAIS